MQQSIGSIYDLYHVTEVKVSGESIVNISHNWEITEVRYLPITAQNGEEIQKIQVVIERKGGEKTEGAES